MLKLVRMGVKMSGPLTLILKVSIAIKMASGEMDELYMVEFRRRFQYNCLGEQMRRCV